MTVINCNNNVIYIVFILFFMQKFVLQEKDPFGSSDTKSQL